MSPPQLRRIPPHPGAASLFTKEDPYNLHKAFGFAVLLHFLYRLSLLPIGFIRGEDLMGFGFGRPETPWLLSLHSGLLLISFFFHIPQKRIKQGSRSECAPNRVYLKTYPYPLRMPCDSLAPIPVAQHYF